MSSIQVNEVSTSWSSTDAGMTSYFNCGDIDGYESGYISRQCNDDGEWSSSVVGHCIYKSPTITFDNDDEWEFTINVAINPITISCDSNTYCDIPIISPPLPKGLSITGNGGGLGATFTITGTPIQVVESMIYTITSHNGD